MRGELSGNFEEAIMALFEATTYYDAWTLNNAMVVRIIYIHLLLTMISPHTVEYKLM